MYFVNKSPGLYRRVARYNRLRLCLVRNVQQDGSASIVGKGTRQPHGTFDVKAQHVPPMLFEWLLHHRFSSQPRRTGPIDDQVCCFSSCFLRIGGFGQGLSRTEHQRQGKHDKQCDSYHLCKSNCTPFLSEAHQQHKRDHGQYDPDYFKVVQ